MELSKEQIEKINLAAPNDWQMSEQGIFTEPYGIPVNIKEPVIYCRYTAGGYSGGSCYGDDARFFERGVPANRMKVLELVIKELKPDITFFQYKELEELIRTNEETEEEYYGNSTDYKIEYILLSELINFLKKM